METNLGWVVQGFTSLKEEKEEKQKIISSHVTNAKEAEELVEFIESEATKVGRTEQQLRELWELPLQKKAREEEEEYFCQKLY